MTTDPTISLDEFLIDALNAAGKVAETISEEVLPVLAESASELVDDAVEAIGDSSTTSLTS